MRDPSIMIMVSYKRRENELSNVYIFEKIILNYWVMYPKTWVSFFQGHPVQYHSLIGSRLLGLITAGSGYSFHVTIWGEIQFLFYSFTMFDGNLVSSLVV